MPLHDFWPFDHVPPSTPDLSTGSGGPSYATNTGTYYQYTGNPGYAYNNGITNAITVGTDGYLKMQSNGTSNPGLAVQAKEVQDWSGATQYWIGFRTKTALQNAASAKVFCVSDVIGQTNATNLVLESDMTAAGASTLNQDYMVEIFIDRTTRAYEVWIAGAKYSSGTLPAATLANGQNTFYWFGPWNSGLIANANRSFRDFYWLDVDATQTPKRLGSIHSVPAAAGGINAPNWVFQSGALSGTAALSSAQAKWGTQSLTMGATNSAASVFSVPDAPWNRFGTYGDCTIEAWVYPLNVTQNGVMFCHDTGSSPYAQFNMNAANILLQLDSASPNLTVASGWTANTWNHIALVFNNGIWYVYSNGVKLGQVTGGTFGNIAAPFRIGNWNGANAFQGYMDGIRVSNVARYPGGTTFTPPSSPFTADANTLMLLQFEANPSGLSHDSATPDLALPSNLAYASTPLAATPILISPSTNDTVSEAFTSGVSSGKILAVDYRVAGQGGGAGSVLAPVLTDGTNNIGLSNLSLSASALQLGRRAALRTASPDGGIWTPAKVTAASLRLTASQANTVSLLHFDGANNSTVFTDAAGLVWTAANGAVISTAQSKFGGSAFSNPGTSGRNISTPDAPTLKLTGDFTVECWAYITSPSTSQIVTTKGSGGRLIVSGGAVFAYDDTGGNQMTGGSVVANTWVHMALVKRSGTTTLYVNGTSVATSTAFGTFGNNTGSLFIGTYFDGTAPLFGFVDEFRISGLARYTSNFTVPSAAFTLD